MQQLLRNRWEIRNIEVILELAANILCREDVCADAGWGFRIYIERYLDIASNGHIYYYRAHCVYLYGIFRTRTVELRRSRGPVSIANTQYWRNASAALGELPSTVFNLAEESRELRSIF